MWLLGTDLTRIPAVYSGDNIPEQTELKRWLPCYYGFHFIAPYESNAWLDNDRFFSVYFHKILARKCNDIQPFPLIKFYTLHYIIHIFKPKQLSDGPKGNRKCMTLIHTL